MKGAMYKPNRPSNPGLLNRNQPLALPKGSVRAILALIVVAPVAVIAMKSGVQFTGDQVIGLVSLVLLAYFNKSNTSDNA